MISHPEHRPFRVTVGLRSPVSLNHPWIMFDSILFHMIRGRRLGREDRVQDIKTPRPLTETEFGPYRRVLARFGARSPGDWMICASASIFDPPDLPYGSLQYFKRFEADGFPDKPAKISPGSGHYRSWMLRTVYLPATTATFYGRGEVGLVRELLDDLTGLGNDTRMGWGEVATVDLIEIDEDRSVVWEGRATRPIPTRLLSAWSDDAQVAWRSSYWDPRNIERCAPPGAEVTLKPWLHPLP